jgi:hypothetical protein
VKRKDVKKSLKDYLKERKIKGIYVALEVKCLRCYSDRRVPVLSISRKRRLKKTEASRVYAESDVGPMEITRIKFEKQFEVIHIYCHEKSIMFFTKLNQGKKCTF